MLNFLASFGRAFLCLMVIFLPLRLEAQDSLKKQAGDAKLEALILIDSSGSMLRTDPLRLRDEGTKYFLQSLKQGDKAGIIEFSNSAKVVHELSPYQPGDTAKIHAAISAIKNEGIYTDLLSGIKLAQEVFQKTSAGDSQRVIVLISDGKMEPDPAKATAEAQSAELFNNYLPQLKAKGIKVHTLALSEFADKELLAQISASTEGIAIYAADANLLHEAFTNLLLAVKKPQVLPLTSRGFKIDANVSEATFYINREGSNEISITSPGGETYTKSLTSSSVKWFSGQKFEVVTIISPAAGDWKISGMQSQDGFATLLTNLQLVTDWPSQVNAEEEKLLQARLYENEKPVMLQGMTGALEYAFQIVPTDKIAEPVMKAFLNDDGKDGDKIANDGIFSKNVKLNDPGEYKLKVVAHSPTFDRYQHLPFQVKDQLIKLKVESRQAESKPKHKTGHDEGHAEGHKEDHHDQHAEEKDDHTEHESKGAEKGAEATGTDEDYFVAILSPEAAELKKAEVKLMAIDNERNRYKIEMHPGDRRNEYELPASVLPHEGHYEIEASISGIGKSKKTETATSSRIEYTLKKIGAEVEIKIEDKTDVEIKPEKKDEPKEEEGPNVPLYLGLITLWNLAAGGAAFVMCKKTASGPKVQLPVFEDVSATKLGISKLKEKLELTEIDITDPIFTEEGDSEPVPASAQPKEDLLAASPGEQEAAPAEAQESAEAAPVEGQEAAPEAQAETQPEAAPEAAPEEQQSEGQPEEPPKEGE